MVILILTVYPMDEADSCMLNSIGKQVPFLEVVAVVLLVEQLEFLREVEFH